MTRWLTRRMFGLCCVALSVAGRPAYGQGPSWSRGIGPDAAKVPAITWQRPVAVDQPESGAFPAAPAFRGQALGVAVIAEDAGPSAFGGAKRAITYLAPAVFGAPLQAPPPRARLGAPVELPLLMPTHVAAAATQYIPPLNRREGTEDMAEGGLLPTTIQLTLPGPHRLFRLDSEAAVQERIRQEARQTRVPTTIEFPEPLRYEAREKILQPRQWPLTRELAQPCYVWHGRLLFEQINSERYGWSMGVVQPAVSALHFYADVAMLPYHLVQDPCCQGDTSAGKCLPGDPVPLLLYPPQGSLSGLSAEAAVITLLFFAFP